MIEITDISSSGMGVGRIDGIVTFVPYTIAGEKAEIEITSKQKNHCLGKVIFLSETSVQRRTPFCPYYEKCGGCTLMHMNYNEQLKVKENIVRQALLRIGKTECDVKPVLSAKCEQGYRNKAAFPVKDGKIGYYMSGSHDIVEISSCPLVCNEINEVLQALKPFVKAHGKSINHVVVRSTGGHTMVTAVTPCKSYPDKTELISSLSSLNIDSINVNYNNDPRQILGSRTENIFGRSAIPYKILGNTFDVSPTAFLQVNDAQAEVLYNTAITLLNLKNKYVIDAYCGTGTISLALAGHAKEVIGIEINPASIENAKKAAQLNGIKNAGFICGKCEKLIPDLLKKSREKPVLFTDPPRAGMEKSLIEAIAKADIEQLVYISCDPSTLARDIGRLMEYGYTVDSVAPVDMFPNTAHIENVALLKK